MIFFTWPKPTPSCNRSETNNNALSKLSVYMAINAINQICMMEGEGGREGGREIGGREGGWSEGGREGGRGSEGGEG